VRKRLGFVLGLWLLGCDDPLKTVELVEEPRLLAARAAVLDDPGRAAPAPGETASVTFLLASPAVSQTQGFALAACPAAPRRSARSECAAEPFAQIVSADGESDTVSLSFQVPADLDPAGRVAVLGIVCPFGSPSDDAQSCDGVEPGNHLTFEFELAREDDVNLSPTLEAASLTFDGQEWPDLAAVEGDCAGLGYVEVEAGSSHSFEVALSEEDRDAVPHAQALDPVRESLQLSHFATGGDLSRAFQSIAWDSDELLRRTTWKAPNAPGLVRFWLVLRDFRGGADFLERDVCVQ
jgi:hypothetical protein